MNQLNKNKHYHKKKYIYTYILKDHFDHSYCKTCHSAQGLSINIDITIFGCNINPYVDKNFIYTAITRVWDLIEYEKNHECKYCHEPLEYELVNNKVYSNITANRMNNMINH